ncbi:anoctamin-5-like isoform X2 [Pollicipes pollicipes]|uniref:anoctamin-5-like isoform X2 n=1 Tax=Pollicipes pollicipes TaxID=41117 RepID=UPI00188515FD|nr:anoctamin-5-like isoform X2 [Pollicipes pollicipes]
MRELPPIQLLGFKSADQEIDRQALLDEITSNGEIAVSLTEADIAGLVLASGAAASGASSRSSSGASTARAGNLDPEAAVMEEEAASLPGFMADEQQEQHSKPAEMHVLRKATDVLHASVDAMLGQSIEMDHEVRRRIDTQFFWDNKRKIDMVLAYREDDDVNRIHKRKTFQANLISEGLELELEDKKHSSDGKTYYLKVHSPWDVLTRYAEIMNLKMPIKEDEPDEDDGPPCCPGMKNPFSYDTNLIPPEPEYFTAGFNRHREHQFVIKSRETFFTSAQRSQIVWQILMRTKYTDSAHVNDRSKVGINRLLNNGAFVAAFPLHDGSYKEDDGSGTPNDRRLLYLEWARPACIHKKQPLWLVRKYFGDKIGLYFAWLGFYTAMLVPAAIVGVLVFIIGLFMVNNDNLYNPSIEICHSNVTMCPLCNKACEYWDLKASCFFSQITYLFDNPATVFFSIFMAFWATMFLEFWKRRQAVIAWEWDLANYEDEEDARPEFEVKATSFRINPVSKEEEPYMTASSKVWRTLASGTIIIFMLMLVVAAVFGVIVYRLAVTTMFQQTRDVFWLKRSKIVTSMTAATLNLIIIVIMNQLYRKVAVWLTNLENPRTQTEYEDSFTFKMFFFQFVNYYSSLVYIAFFKNRFYTHPGQAGDTKNVLVQTQADVCDPAGCLFELCIQLAIIMVGKQVLSNFIEILFPKIMNWWRARASLNKVEDTKELYTRWEQDHDLQGLDTLSLFEEYLEMVIQYGFVTLFVAAFPLAPFFALINNIGEIRLDAYKYVTQVRRPLAQRVQDIGAWYGILRGITYLAVTFNALVIAFTSDFIPRLVYWYKYSESGTLDGYINGTLSVFNTSDFPPGYAPDPQIDDRKFETCRYRGFRTPPDSEHPYETNMMYWHVFGARLAFVAIFEHVVIGLTGVMAYAIPDIPGNVKVQINRERMLAREAQFEAEMYRLKKERELTQPPASRRSSSRETDSRASWRISAPCSRRDSRAYGDFAS